MKISRSFSTWSGRHFLGGEELRADRRHVHGNVVADAGVAALDHNHGADAAAMQVGRDRSGPGQDLEAAHADVLADAWR